MTEYTQGVCEYGAAILKDGLPMTIEEILGALRENATLREGMKGDYDLDAWLEWVNESSRFKALYVAVNEVMEIVGCHGEINSQHNKVDALMDTLFKIDGGVYDVDKAFGSKEED